MPPTRYKKLKKYLLVAFVATITAVAVGNAPVAFWGGAISAWISVLFTFILIENRLV